jgi:hypothetical protein
MQGTEVGFVHFVDQSGQQLTEGLRFAALRWMDGKT